MRPQCPCGYDDGGSHYHCANCNGLSGMTGHYVHWERKFNCPENPIGVVDDEELTQFINELHKYEGENE